MLTTRRSIIATALFLPLLASNALGADETLAKRLREAVPPHGERALGDPKAPVTMIEYASATCPHCAEFHNTIWPDLKKDYVETGKVYFIFREFPLDDLAMGAFMLSRCAPPEKYFATIDLMFRQQRTWTKTDPKGNLFKIVGMAGVSADAAEACIKNRDLAKAIFDTRNRANKEFGVKGTPSFFVNGTYVNAHDDVAAVRKTLDVELKRLGRG